MSTTKYLASSMIVFFSLLVYSSIAFSSSFDTPAASAILMEAKTGQVLFEKDADTSMPPASITKLMTLLLAFEEIEKDRAKWDDLVEVSENAWRMGGSQMFLNIGQRVTYGELVTGISVISANDACVAIAEHIYGSESSFVTAMNRKATELGLQNSGFKNSSGLPEEGHYMSARDIAILSRYLINKFPQILELESMKEFTFNNIRQFNRNPLLGTLDGADGLKTGWTTEAGYCLVGTAEQFDLRLISVVLNTKSEDERNSASRSLLNHGFRNFEWIDIVNQNEIIQNVQVLDSKERNVDIYASTSVSAIVSEELRGQLKQEITINEPLVAPIRSGSVVGELKLTVEDQVIGRTDLIVSEDVSRVNLFVRLFRRILKLFGIG
jgi:serine-type D-Ala-D-Ala carboxypeptidase (penicillin-binding protein 5/6)